MAKQGMHNHDDRDSDVSRGPNNPEKSVNITTGSPKKQETYEKQAHNHQANNKPAQNAKPEWIEDTRVTGSREAKSEERQYDKTERNGSRSNES